MLDSSWSNTPSYDPPKSLPKFVREKGLSKSTPPPSSATTSLDKGAQVRSWYQSFTSSSSASDPTSASTSVIPSPDGEPVGASSRVPSAFSIKTPASFAADVKTRPVAPLVKRRVYHAPYKAPKPPPGRTADPTWFISQALAASSSSSADPSSASTVTSSSTSTPTSASPSSKPPPLPFSLLHPHSQSSSSSRPAVPSSLASQLNLPEPGSSTAPFKPPTYFALGPGHKGHQMIKNMGWEGGGLGKSDQPQSVGAVSSSKGKGKEKAKAWTSDAEGEYRKKRRKNEKKGKGKALNVGVEGPDGTIDLTQDSDSDSDSHSSSSSSSSSAGSHYLPASPPPPFSSQLAPDPSLLLLPPSLSSSPLPPSTTAPTSNPYADTGYRTQLIAPLPTTLKLDQSGIRSSSLSSTQRRITHSHKELRDAERKKREEEGRWSAKEIGRRAKREREERMELMGVLNGD